MLVYVFMKVIL